MLGGNRRRRQGGDPGGILLTADLWCADLAPVPTWVCRCLGDGHLRGHCFRRVLLETVEGGVEGPARDLAVRPPLDLLPDGDGIGVVFQPEDGQQDDFLELAELMCLDAVHRTESCGAHFRVESQTPDGEPQRDDEHFSYVAAWAHGPAPVLHKEPLTFAAAHPVPRSYR